MTPCSGSSSSFSPLIFPRSSITIIFFYRRIPSFFFFFFNDTAPTEIYPLSLPDALPIFRWKTFSQLVLRLANDLGVERVVTFGSLLADVPHTRPAPVTAAATDETLMEELGLEPSRYEGPTGIVGVLLDACRGAGGSSLSLWAAVPPYGPAAPSP